MKKVLSALVVAALSAAGAAEAAWPERAIRIVVPYGPGGSTDNTMRGGSAGARGDSGPVHYH